MGKQLAFMELRQVIASLVHGFDVEFAPGQTSEAFEEGKRDTFNLMCPKLELVFTPRK